MSRNSIFIILGLISAAIAYFFAPLLSGLAELVVTERLPHEYNHLLQSSDIVAFAGFISLFGLSFFLLYVIFPLSYVWYHINSAQNVIGELPPASDALNRTSKKIFLAQLKDMGFVGRLARAYGACLVQEAEQEISTETLKNLRLIKKNIGRNKNKKIVIHPVRATAPAETIFNADSLLYDNLLLGFFNILARFLVGAGVILLGISILSFSLTQDSQLTLMSALQPGMTALLYCLVSAVVISAATHLFDLLLSQNCRTLARMINRLFHRGDWQRDIKNIQGHIVDNPPSEQFETILQTSIDKPMREISRAIKLLAVEQETKMDNILSKTLDNFVGNLEKKSATNVENLNKALKDASHTADLMKKQLAGANSSFSRQMDKQATAIARHLANMQKVLTNSERTTQKGSERIISSLATEVKASYRELDEFIKGNLKNLDDKQARIDKALENKNTILRDLHNSAKDLGTISNASGMLLERFIALSTGLDSVLNKIQQNGFDQGNGEKRDKFRLAMIKLKKTNKNRIGKLPEM